MNIKIKICGLTRENDLQFCEKNRIDFAGFIFHPQSPRYISPEKAAKIKGMEGRRVGVFVRQTPEQILNMTRTARLDFIQLHGGQSPDFCACLPQKKLIKVFWPEKYAAMQDMLAAINGFLPVSRYFLLDAGSGGGGHGRTIQSPLFSECIKQKETFLAGGLSPENIRTALQKKPYALDVNSGVEISPGIKDHDLIREVVRMVQDTKQQKLNKILANTQTKEIQ
ncbi:MAG: phosphoribosylanthranilate isomerase [Thermodesulfobacteriota bacterium]